MTNIVTSDQPELEPPPPARIPPTLARLARKACAIVMTAAIVLYFLFVGLVLVLRYAILPSIEQYRDDIEKAASTALGARVTVARATSTWHGMNPHLTLQDVVVHGQDGQVALRLPEVRATLSWETLLVADLRFASLEILRPELDIRRDARGQLFVAGIFIDPERSDSRMGEWVLAQHRIIVRDARVRWNDALRAAPELALSSVQFMLVKSGRAHDFGLQAVPPATLAAPLDVRGHIEHPYFSRLSDPRAWRGELYANLANVDLAAWLAWVDYPIELTRGSGTVRAWLAFSPPGQYSGRASRLPDLALDVRLRNVVTRLRDDLPQLGLTSVSGRIQARELLTGDELSLRNFSLRATDGLTLAPIDLRATRQFARGARPEQGELSASTLNLETLASIAERLPIPPAIHQLIDAYQPRGHLHKLSFKWQGPFATPQAYDVSTGFEALSIEAQPAPDTLSPTGTPVHHAGRPGFENLSGELNANTKGGKLKLSGRNSALSLPGIFAEPTLRLTRLDGQAEWTVAEDDLEVRIATLNLENAHASGSASGLYRRGPASGSARLGWLDLSGNLRIADARQVARYMPVVVPEQTRLYLQHALLGGASDDTSFKVRGVLEDFPFSKPSETIAPLPDRNAGKGTEQDGFGRLLREMVLKPGAASPGEFRVVARIRDGKLDFAPLLPGAPGQHSAWPVIEDVAGDLIFDKADMQIRNASGRIFGVRLTKVSGDAPDLLVHDDHLLRIGGHASGPLQDYARFVNGSPVTQWIDRFGSQARASGNATLDLKLELPLSHMDRSKVSGTVQFNNNDIALAAAMPAIQRVKGKFDFSEKGFALRDISGQFLGGPIRLNSTAHADGTTIVRGDGSVAVQGMRRASESPLVQNLASRLDGTTRYTIAINLRRAGATPRPANEPVVVVESSLAGLALNLPAPLGKAAADSMPMRIESVPTSQAGDTDEIRVKLGTSVSAVFERRRGTDGTMSVARAAYGVNEEAILTDAAAFANLTIKALDLDAWQAVAAQFAASGTAEKPGGTETGADNFLPDVIAARTEELRVAGKSFHHVVMAASRNDNIWQVNIDSDQVAGYATWRQVGRRVQQDRLTARLVRLTIPQSVAAEVTTLLDPVDTDIPALDIVADNFQLRDLKLGRLELTAFNTITGGRREWRLRKLTLTNPDAMLEADGAWGPEPDGQRTRMKFTLTASNVGGLLNRFGQKNVIRGGSAKMGGEISWRGSPLSLDYGSLDGKLELEAGKGQFLKAEPGIAKLLGVLSLQALPRRITLDFRDVFSEGFAFDAINSTATIERGIVSTKDFKMRGVSASVLIEGSADLARETQDLHVLVLPQVDAAGGTLAYALLANPAIGLGAFLAQMILKDPISRAFSFEYNISGSWADPKVTKVQRYGQPDATKPPPGQPDAATPQPAAP